MHAAFIPWEHDNGNTEKKAGFFRAAVSLVFYQPNSWTWCFFFFFPKHWILLFGGFSLHVLFMTDINPYLESRNLCKFCAVKDIHEIQLHSWVWSPALHSGTQWESERQQAEVEIKQIGLDIRINFFPLGTTRQWSSCLEQPPALEGFKTWLDQTLSNLTWSHGWLWSEQEVGLKDFLTSLPTPVVLWS